MAHIAQFRMLFLTGALFVQLASFLESVHVLAYRLPLIGFCWCVFACALISVVLDGWFCPGVNFAFPNGSHRAVSHAVFNWCFVCSACFFSWGNFFFQVFLRDTFFFVFCCFDLMCVSFCWFTSNTSFVLGLLAMYSCQIFNQSWFPSSCFFQMFTRPRKGL